MEASPDTRQVLGSPANSSSMGKNFSSRVHQLPLPRGSFPNWEGKGDSRAASASFAILHSLKQSRQGWLSGAVLPRLRTQHTLHFRGQCDLQIGAHIFLSTNVYEAHYPPVHRPAPLLAPEDPTTLVGKIQKASESDPEVARLLTLANTKRASSEDMARLNAIVGRIKAAPAAPLIAYYSLPPPFDLVLEFSESSSTRWILPRGAPRGHPGSGAVTCERVDSDCLVTTSGPFVLDSGKGTKKGEGLEESRNAERVMFKFKSPSSPIYETLMRWCSGDQGVAANMKILSSLAPPPREYLAHRLADGALLSQLQQLYASPLAPKKSIERTTTSTPRPPRLAASRKSNALVDTPTPIPKPRKRMTTIADTPSIRSLPKSSLSKPASAMSYGEDMYTTSPMQSEPPPGYSHFSSSPVQLPTNVPMTGPPMGSLFTPTASTSKLSRPVGRPPATTRPVIAVSVSRVQRGWNETAPAVSPVHRLASARVRSLYGSGTVAQPHTISSDEDEKDEKEGDEEWQGEGDDDEDDEDYAGRDDRKRSRASSRPVTRARRGRPPVPCCLVCGESGVPLLTVNGYCGSCMDSSQMARFPLKDKPSPTPPHWVSHAVSRTPFFDFPLYEPSPISRGYALWGGNLE